MRSKLVANPERGTIDRLAEDGSLINTVGYARDDGYLVVKIGCRQCKVHRLIWEAVHGTIPKGFEIDHINGVKSDNRISNLRLVTHAQNMQNRKRAHKNNVSSKVKGVYFCKQTKKWRAMISVSGKKMHIGRFGSLMAAKIAYAEAAGRLHTHNPSANEFR